MSRTILRIITAGETAEAVAYLSNGRRTSAVGATREQAKALLRLRLLKLRETIDEVLIALDGPMRVEGARLPEGGGGSAYNPGTVCPPCGHQVGTPAAMR